MSVASKPFAAPRLGMRALPVAPLLLAGVVALVPWLMSDIYGRYVAVTFFVNASLAVSYQLLFGYARLVSFGHAALFGLGLYGAGVGTQQLGLPMIVSWAATLAFVAVFAVVFGWIVLRLGELFLAVVTLSFGLALVILLQQIGYVGGGDGLVVAPVTIGSVDQGLLDYYFAGVVFLVVLYVASRLARFRFGRLVHTTGNDPVVAQSTGTNVTVVRVQVFVVSALMAALAGIVYAHTQGVIAPTVLGLDRSILILAMVVVGGLASMPGALLGAALLTAAPELLASFSNWSTLVYGALLIAVPLLAPRGLAGVGASVRKRLRERDA